MFSRVKLSEKSDSRVKQILSRAPWEKKSILCYIANKNGRKAKKKTEKYTPKYPFYDILKARNEFFRQICPNQNVFF